MQIISNIALITINETLFIQLITFLIFLFIINRIMIQPLRDVTHEREAHIQKIQLDSTAAGQKVDQLLKQIAKQETKVINTANDIREKIEESGKHEADEIVQEAHREVEKLSQANHRELTALVAEAKKSVQKEAETIAHDMMEKLLDRRLS